MLQNTRQQRRAEERKFRKAVEVMEKLSPTQIAIIIDYLETVMGNIWDNLECVQYMVMRQHKISDERIKKIFQDIREVTNNSETSKFRLNTSGGTPYVVLKLDWWYDIVESLQHTHCRNCTGTNDKCVWRQIMDKTGTPEFAGFERDKSKCKYYYSIERGNAHDNAVKLNTK